MTNNNRRDSVRVYVCMRLHFFSVHVCPLKAGINHISLDVPISKQYHYSVCLSENETNE